MVMKDLAIERDLTMEKKKELRRTKVEIKKLKKEKLKKHGLYESLRRPIVQQGQQVGCLKKTIPKSV